MENKRKTDYNSINVKINERLQKILKPVKKYRDVITKRIKKINNEEGD